MWKDNPGLWPELEYPEVYDCFINIVYTKEATKSRKLIAHYGKIFILVGGLSTRLSFHEVCTLS